MGVFSDDRIAVVREFRDANGDGWDDRWVAQFPDIDTGSLTNDSNGDGTPDFFEMVADRDPYERRPAPPRPRPWDVIRAEQRSEAARAAAIARAKAALAPFEVDCMRDEHGRPTTVDAKRTKRIRKSQALVERLRAEQVDRDRRVEAFLDSPRGRRLSPKKRKALMDVVDGHPHFVTALGHNQADSIGVKHLWPGGDEAVNLTGGGAAVAMWDIGAIDVRADTLNFAHEQFTTGSSTIVAPARDNTNFRVVNFDLEVVRDDDGEPILDEDGYPTYIEPGEYSEHATAVATVIAGAGRPTVSQPGDPEFVPTGFPEPDEREHARGMAFEAGLRAYDRTDDLNEMGVLAAAQTAGTLDIVFSNHAYGTTCGWQREFGEGIDDWVWHGKPTVSEEEDPKFGAYLERTRMIDQIVHDNPTYLPVWAAGNESYNVDYGSTVIEHSDAGPFDSGSDMIIVEHLVPATPRTYTSKDFFNGTIPDRYRDHAKENILPEACAKNVLTVAGFHASEESTSQGPTDDFRIKPDIKARGGDGNGLDRCASAETGNLYFNIEGSSYAAAGVTGALALLRQRWQQLHGTGGEVQASTWKALAIAAASCTQPNLREGYGAFDVRDGLAIVEADVTELTLSNLSVPPNIGTGGARVIEVVVRDGQTLSFDIEKTSDQGTFCVVACWADPPAPPPALPPAPPEPELNPHPIAFGRLVNDIDLRVVPADGGEEWEPWRAGVLIGGVLGAERGDNTQDNVEVVSVPGSAGDEGDILTVQLSSTKDDLDGGEQRVSIVLKDSARFLHRPFEVESLVRDEAAGTATIAWHSMPGCTYRVEHSSDLETWTAIPGDIPSHQQLTALTFSMAGIEDDQSFRVRSLP